MDKFGNQSHGLTATNVANTDLSLNAYKEGYLSRQPEIDALKASLEGCKGANEYNKAVIRRIGDLNDALKAENERQRSLLRDLPPLCEIERFQRIAAELRKDAERYRWLRDKSATSFITRWHTQADVIKDQQIDSAMKDFSTT